MQLKSLLTSLFVLSLPLSVLGGKGRVSYYEPQPSKSDPPACGEESKYFAEYYIALNRQQLDPDKKNLCGKCIKIVYKNKYLVGRLVDRCRGCGEGGLDISPSMFRHFEDLDTGIFYTNWEYVSCDHYGKKGTCSDSNCGMSGSSSSSKSTTSKVSSATTSTTTSVVQTVTTTASGISATTVAPNTSNTNIINTATNSTNTTDSTEVQSAADSTVTNNNSTTIQSSNAKSTDNNKIVSNIIKENNDDDNNGSLVIPVTGVLMVSGAAGIGLLYVKSKRSDVKSLKEAFPEAFKSIKRSLTNGASIRRNITRTYTKRRPHLHNTDKANTVDGDSNTKDTNTSSNQYSEMDISETRITVN